MGGPDHRYDIYLPNRLHISFIVNDATKGESLINVISQKIKDPYVLCRKSLDYTHYEPLYTNSPDQTILPSDANSAFPSNSLLSLHPAPTTHSRMALFVLMEQDYHRRNAVHNFQFIPSELIKTQRNVQIKVILPTNLVVNIKVSIKHKISKLNSTTFQKMASLYDITDAGGEADYRIGTVNGCYPSLKIRFCEAKEFMEALREQRIEPNVPKFVFKPVKMDTAFDKNIEKIIKNLDLPPPKQDNETNALFRSISKLRQNIINERNQQFQTDPLSTLVRISSDEPPLTQKLLESEIGITAELRSADISMNMTKTSAKVPLTLLPSEVVNILFDKLKSKLKSDVQFDPSQFVMLVQGMDEVIAGDYPLSHFVSIREFLLGSRKIFGVLLLEKTAYLNSVTERENSIEKFEEPPPLAYKKTVRPKEFKQIKFGGIAFIPNYCVTTPFQIHLIRLSKHPPKPFTTTVALINGTSIMASQTTKPRYTNRIEARIELPLTLTNMPRTAQVSITISDGTYHATTNFSVFGFDGWLRSGITRRRLWPNKEMDVFLTTSESTNPDSPIIEFEIPTFRFPVCFKQPKNLITSNRRQSTMIVQKDKAKLEKLTKYDPLDPPTNEEKNLLWQHRTLLQKNHNILPMLLMSIDYANPSQVNEIPGILEHWNAFSPVDALSLLDARFPDKRIRKFAIACLDRFPDSELSLYILQIVQALKFELYEDSPLAKFLIRRGLKEPKFLGHTIFWQLMSEAHLSHIRQRFSNVLINLVYGMGIYRDELFAGYKFTNQLVKLNLSLQKENHTVATEKFREALRQFDLPNDFHLPNDPRLIVKSFIVDQCKVMDSKKKPFWLVFENSQPYSPEPVRILFKVGDDLRQDQLTLQLMKVMEHLWRQNGLELQMRIYSVLPTGDNQGYIEVVPNASTEEEIQIKNGIINGVIEKSIMINYLKENNNGILYKIAQENFLVSSAAYAVSTAVLGVADRHPGNIMIQKDGHYFHIDYGHFLGNFKKKLNYQREKAPYHYSPACMAVIADDWEQFIDIGTVAYNILRKHSTLLITLLMLMMGSGIPELRKPEDIFYMRNMLFLSLSDDDMKGQFRKLSQESVESTRTALNNFFHNFRKGGG